MKSDEPSPDASHKPVTGTVQPANVKVIQPMTIQEVKAVSER